MTLWIGGCFKGSSGPQNNILFYMLPDFVAALLAVVVGLSLSVSARMIRCRMCACAEEMETEMQCAALQLENYLLLYQNDRGKPSKCSAT